MTSIRPRLLSVLAACASAAALSPEAARAGPMPPPPTIAIVTGTYSNISAAPDKAANPPAGGTSTFYLRQPTGLTPSNVTDMSVIGVTLLPSSNIAVEAVGTPQAQGLAVDLFLPPAGDELDVTTLGPPTLKTAFKFVAPETLTPGNFSGGGLVSGISLAKATDPAFTPFLTGGGFSAQLNGITIGFSITGAAGGAVPETVTPLASFNSLNGSTSAPFTLSSGAVPGVTTPIPEPGSLPAWAVVGAAAGGLGLWRRGRRRRPVSPAAGP